MGRPGTLAHAVLGGAGNWPLRTQPCERGASGSRSQSPATRARASGSPQFKLPVRELVQRDEICEACGWSNSRTICSVRPGVEAVRVKIRQHQPPLDRFPIFELRYFHSASRISKFILPWRSNTSAEVADAKPTAHNRDGQKQRAEGDECQQPPTNHRWRSAMPSHWSAKADNSSVFASRLLPI